MSGIERIDCPEDDDGVEVGVSDAGWGSFVANVYDTTPENESPLLFVELHSLEYVRASWDSVGIADADDGCWRHTFRLSAYAGCITKDPVDESWMFKNGGGIYIQNGIRVQPRTESSIAVSARRHPSLFGFVEGETFVDQLDDTPDDLTEQELAENLAAVDPDTEVDYDSNDITEYKEAVLRNDAINNIGYLALGLGASAIGVPLGVTAAVGLGVLSVVGEPDFDASPGAFEQSIEVVNVQSANFQAHHVTFDVLTRPCAKGTVAVESLFDVGGGDADDAGRTVTWDVSFDPPCVEQGPHGSELRAEPSSLKESERLSAYLTDVDEFETTIAAPLPDVEASALGQSRIRLDATDTVLGTAPIAEYRFVIEYLDSKMSGAEVWSEIDRITTPDPVVCFRPDRERRQRVRLLVREEGSEEWVGEAQDEFHVDSASHLHLTADQDIYELEDTVVADASDTYIGGTSPDQYTWYLEEDGEEVVELAQTSRSTIVEVTVASFRDEIEDGSYDLVVEIDTEDGETYIASTDVEFEGVMQPVARIDSPAGGDQVAEDRSLQLDASSSEFHADRDPESYHWTFSNGDERVTEVVDGPTETIPVSDIIDEFETDLGPVLGTFFPVPRPGSGSRSFHWRRPSSSQSVTLPEEVTAQLLVEDDGGDVDTASVTFDVVEDDAADLEAVIDRPEPERQFARDATIEFDASGSRIGGHGSIREYDWRVASDSAEASLPIDGETGTVSVAEIVDRLEPWEALRDGTPAEGAFEDDLLDETDPGSIPESVTVTIELQVEDLDGRTDDAAVECRLSRSELRVETDVWMDAGTAELSFEAVQPDDVSVEDSSVELSLERVTDSGKEEIDTLSGQPITIEADESTTYTGEAEFDLSNGREIEERIDSFHLDPALDLGVDVDTEGDRATLTAELVSGDDTISDATWEVFPEGSEDDPLEEYSGMEAEFSDSAGTYRADVVAELKSGAVVRESTGAFTLEALPELSIDPEMSTDGLETDLSVAIEPSDAGIDSVDWKVFREDDHTSGFEDDPVEELAGREVTFAGEDGVRYKPRVTVTPELGSPQQASPGTFEAEEQTEIDDISAERTLEDNEVQATVTIEPDDAPTGGIDWELLRMVDGQWETQADASGQEVTFTVTDDGQHACHVMVEPEYGDSVETRTESFDVGDDANDDDPVEVELTPEVETDGEEIHCDVTIDPDDAGIDEVTWEVYAEADGSGFEDEPYTTRSGESVTFDAEPNRYRVNVVVKPAAGEPVEQSPGTIDVEEESDDTGGSGGDSGSDDDTGGSGGGSGSDDDTGGSGGGSDDDDCSGLRCYTPDDDDDDDDGSDDDDDDGSDDDEDDAGFDDDEERCSPSDPHCDSDPSPGDRYS